MAPRWLTEAEMKARYGAERVNALADVDGDGVPDAGVVEGAILDAEGRAESRLLARYAPDDLPTTTANASVTLKRIVSGLAWWYLHQRFDVLGDDVRAAYDGALSELADVVRGGASLVLADSPAIDLSAPVVRKSTKEAKGTFTLEAMEDW